MPPLEAYLHGLIERHGPITVAEYMALALSHPDHGYYQGRDPFGRGGDFVTAPEISQIFGEVMAAWCIETWVHMGAPEFQLVEFGPGRGTLMRDLLRIAARIKPEFVRAATINLVETSPVLRAAQSRLLGEYAPFWREGIEDVPHGPSLFLMNEFLDALPVRQFVLTAQGLCERRVGAGDGRFAFLVEREPRVPASALPSATRGLPVGSIVETCPAALAITRDLAARIAAQGGAAMIVDYGYASPMGKDTFQAVRAHAYADPLQAPGEADLTAHVDFGALARAAATAGALVYGPFAQGEFLTGLGIEYRARTLIEGGDVNAMAALRRLVDPGQMGELFKVLVIAR